MELPREIFCQILNYLKWTKVISLARTCKKWRDIIYDVSGKNAIGWMKFYSSTYSITVDVGGKRACFPFGDPDWFHQPFLDGIHLIDDGGWPYADKYRYKVYGIGSLIIKLYPDCVIITTFSQARYHWGQYVKLMKKDIYWILRLLQFLIEVHVGFSFGGFRKF
jgi:hypothetical protein